MELAIDTPMELPNDKDDKDDKDGKDGKDDMLVELEGEIEEAMAKKKGRMEELAEELVESLDGRIAYDIQDATYECSSSVHDACLYYIQKNWRMGWDVTERFDEKGDDLTLTDPTVDAVLIEDLDYYLLRQPTYFDQEFLEHDLAPEAPPHLRHEAIASGCNIKELSLVEYKEVMMDKAIDTKDVIGQWFEGKCMLECDKEGHKQRELELNSEKTALRQKARQQGTRCQQTFERRLEVEIAVDIYQRCPHLHDIEAKKLETKLEKERKRLLEEEVSEEEEEESEEEKDEEVSEEEKEESEEESSEEETSDSQ